MNDATASLTPAEQPSYSTTEVARLLGVSQPTVQRWVDQGLLMAWKTPGGHRRIDAQSAHEFRAQRNQDKPVAPSTSPPTILLVEDDAIDREVASAVIAATWPHARLYQAANGIEALLMIGQFKPDIVLSDIVMPHMNGLEVLRQLSQMENSKPRLLVAITSLKPARIAEMGGLPPKVLLIPKPIEPDMAQVALVSAWQQIAW
ncbi:response regulator [Duganella sp. FT3S]|uniref:Response regulator n=1 Tax=Rugamonas fusca TaxID=2758568 RepID=A0A7W2I8L6_9BURK|nr:response regulator [Rugamonas fusca]MBA5607742.1 response regulator [Rugamonas fusca]